ncbi:MAG TPA: flagellar export chaperone FliS [Rhodocyclaceae bacterium]|nr:flagellar export chaperone FliS [Rhodocyclaceae bacterium]
MFHSSPINAYRQLDLETEVITADPHRLIQLLLDGALGAISDAKVQMANNNIAAKGNAISKAIDIIANGLKVSLDVEQGGDLARRLIALYDYMAVRLLHANMRNDPGALEEVGTLLQQIAEAWSDISDEAKGQGG